MIVTDEMLAEAYGAWVNAMEGTRDKMAALRAALEVAFTPTPANSGIPSETERLLNEAGSTAVKAAFEASETERRLREALESGDYLVTKTGNGSCAVEIGFTSTAACNAFHDALLAFTPSREA